MELKNCCQINWKNPHFILKMVAIILFSLIIIVAILRDRWTNNNNNQVTIIGRGEVAYQPDEAIVKLGVQVDKAATAEIAVNQLSQKINDIISAVEALGIERKNIETQNYSLYPQYDYKNGASNVSGYSANQQISIKVENVAIDQSMLNKVIAVANQSGSNQILGVDFQVSSLNDLKEQARLAAMADARAKTPELAKAAGLKKLSKVVGWYETVVESPDMNGPDYGGMGAGGEMAIKSSLPTPQVTNGEKKIIIEIGLNYEIN